MSCRESLFSGRRTEMRMRDKLTRDGSNTTRKTAVRLTAETKDAVLGKLRHAVAFQIGLWDAALEIAEMVDADLGLVLEWVNAISIVAVPAWSWDLRIWKISSVAAGILAKLVGNLPSIPFS